MHSNAVWIWKNYKASVNELVLFRKTILFHELPKNYLLHISADSRYKLYINNQHIGCGPGKSSSVYKYYDEIDISSFLKVGSNVIAIEAAHYSGDMHDSIQYDTGPTSVLSTCRGGLLVMDITPDSFLNTNSTWKCYDCQEYKFVKSTYTSSADFNDEIDGTTYPFRWKMADFDDSSWISAKEILTSDPYLGKSILSPWSLKQREIPMPYLKKIAFKKIMRNSENLSSIADFLQGAPITISRDTQAWMELDIGEYLNAELCFSVTGGLGGKINLIYGESYGVYDANNQFIKNIRDDCSENNQINGDIQTFYCGSGDQEYVPYGYKTFRFLRIEFMTEGQELTLNGIDVFETGYPWDFKGSFSSHDAVYNRLWDVSLKTIQRCTYETFMDCPYYERMQYVMDTMLQANYLYGITDDHRLIKQALRDFSDAQLPNGIIPCCAPSNFISIIPGFMLFYIFFLNEYYEFTGDLAYVKRFIPTAEKIIDYFSARKLDNDLIGNTGYWQFVDWAKEWRDGSPVDSDEDVNIIYNMMMVKALNDLANLLDALHRFDTAKEYRTLGDSIGNAIKKYAWDAKSQLYSATTDHKKTKSQHAQVWAVLSGLENGERAKSIMQTAIEDASLCQCSYAMSYFLFRALEKTGLYHYTQHLLTQWTDLLKLNLTTWPEDPISQRSDCHAWSAIPLYEFTACYLGVKPLSPGYGKVLIRPLALWLPSCKGQVVTPQGIIEVNYTIAFGNLNLQVNLPENIEAVIEMPDGSSHSFHQSTIEFSYKV